MTTARTPLALALLLAAAPARAADVLVLWDTLDEDTPALEAALVAAGHTVTYGDTVESEYDGTNPAPDGFDAVIHLNGTTHAEDMPSDGQIALVDYVAAGGGFIHGEWNAYEHLYARMAYMEDLTLLERASGTEGTVTVEVVGGMEAHPVLDGVAASFSFSAGWNVGSARDFDSDPVEVLARDTSGNDAVVVREWGAGRVVGFHHAGNYNSYGTLADATVQLIYTNAVNWTADCTDGDGDGFLGSCGGDDCDDTDPSVYVGAPEVDADGLDQDCNGVDSGVDSDADGLDDDVEVDDHGTDAFDDDTDDDGALDGDEVSGTTDPLDADTDDDALLDGDELGRGTDPTDADSDDDALIDGGEIEQGTDPLEEDSDADGLRDGDEVGAGTDPLLADTDGDGLLDGDERNGGTDPTLADTDGGGTTDGVELVDGTDPLDGGDDIGDTTDTDGDGLPDRQEMALGTDRTLADTDGDTLGDGDEVESGTDPLNDDTDGDALGDGDEVALGTDPLHTDSDLDGLLDGEEVGLGTDPLVADSDGGSVTDGDEVEAGTDPLDAADDVDEGDPVGEDPDAEDPDAKDPDKSACGCAAAPAPSDAWLAAALIGLAAARRRKRL
jgi:MYXO-CTERM domain-containing protein